MLFFNRTTHRFAVAVVLLSTLGGFSVEVNFHSSDAGTPLAEIRKPGILDQSTEGLFSWAVVPDLPQPAGLSYPAFGESEDRPSSGRVLALALSGNRLWQEKTSHESATRVEADRVRGHGAADEAQADRLTLRLDDFGGPPSHSIDFVAQPRLSVLSLGSATIEFQPARGIRHATIEFELARGIRHATIEFELARGIRHATIEFELARGIRHATIEFECDPDCAVAPDTPQCDDCNLNGVFDGCDLDAGTSIDVEPVDGIPDECVGATTAGQTINWSAGDNWDLGGLYPDNEPTNPDGVPDLSVTFNSADNLLVDVNIEVNTFRLRSGSTLNVTQTGGGDFSVVEAGGVLDEGSILVANDRKIDVGGNAFTIGPNGLYAPDPTINPGSTGDGCESGVSVCASLATGNLTIQHEPGVPRGEMILDGAMTVDISGDFVVDASEACLSLESPCEDCGFPNVLRSARGGVTPAVVKVRDFSSMSMAGNFVLLGAVSILLESAEPVIIGSNFVNQSTRPDCFDAADGFIQLGYRAKRGLLNAKAKLGITPQYFEVAGRDLGATLAGFDTGTDSNFALAKLEVTAGHQVSFVNNFSNILPVEACSEALYVGDLVLRDGAKITVDDCRIYYMRLIQEPNATVVKEGCGDLVPLCDGSPTAPRGDAGRDNPFNRTPVNPIEDDCQTNGVPDLCDIQHGTSLDCNENGVPDECDLASCLAEEIACRDCDGNGIPDECDADADQDGVPDACDMCPGYDDGESCPIPAASAWSLTVMTLLVLTAGSLVLAKRRRLLAAG